MSSGNDYRRRENNYRNIDIPKYINNNNNRYKTKTETSQTNKSPSKTFYVKIDPENLEKKFKKENYALQNKRKDNINNNNTNNSYMNNNLQQSFCLRNVEDRKSPIKYNKNNFIYYINNTSDNKNRKSDKKNNDKRLKEIRTISPIKSFNSNRINNRKYYTIQTNDENKTLYNNDLSYNKKNTFKNLNYNIESNSFSRTGNKDIPSLNIYLKKLTIIFVRLLDKIIWKHKKNEIMDAFFKSLKKNCSFHNNNKEKDNTPQLFKKKESKYNEYKDILPNYAKNNNNGESVPPNNNNSQNALELINKKKNQKKEPIYKKNKNNKELKKKHNSNKKKDIKRLKELEKKYEKIYENKKNENISFDNNYRNYILRKYKTQNSFEPKRLTDNNSFLSNLNFINNDEHLILDNVLKSKLLRIQFMRNIRNLPKMNYSQEIIPNLKYVNLKKYITLTTNNLNNEDKSDENETPIKKKEKNTEKRLLISPNKNNNNSEEKTYKIINVKDIQTADKRLNVYINYITLYNDKTKKNYNYYDNDLLKISNNFNFNYINEPLNKKTKKKNIFRKLDKIEEEPEEKNFNSSHNKKNNNRLTNNNNAEEGFLILEKDMNDSKKKAIKDNINNKKEYNVKEININRNNIREKYKLKKRRDEEKIK